MSELLRILLVEDQPGSARLAQDLLAKSPGLDLTVCPNLDDVRRRLLVNSSDVVLMSWSAGSGRNWETELREWVKSRPVILLMGQDDPVEAAWAIGAGVQDCIPMAELNRNLLLRSIDLAMVRQRQVESLRSSEARYRLLFERNLAGVYRCTRDGRIVDANRALAMMLGYETGEDLKQHTAWEFYFDRTQRDASLSRLNSLSSVTNSELCLRRRDGQAIWVLENMILLDEEPGVPPLIEGTLIDITERKQLEESLAREQDLLFTLMEFLPDSIYFKDTQSRFVRVSRACARKFGVADPNDVEAKSDFDFFAASHARDALADELEMMRTGKGMIAKEEMEVWPDGSITWASTTKMPMRNPMGNVIGTFGVTRDITSIKNDQARIEHLQQQNELILNSVGEGICGLDQDGRITFINPAAAQLTGWTIPELIGKRLHDLVHPRRLAGCSGDNCALQSALLDHNRHQHEEAFIRRDGGSFPVEFISNAMYDAAGDPAGAVLAFRDISERREIERMKDEFISVVSHELRTPLTSVRGALGLLASGRLGVLPENGRKMLGIAASNTDRLVRLINDILDLERIGSGRIRMDCTACDLEQLLQQSVDLMRPMAERAGVRLQIRATPTTFWADPDRLQQTLSNLISNAIKFSSPGSMVEIAAGERDQSIWIDVEDQGRGIPIEHLEKIFERFHQVDKSDSRDKGGTGLGLPICRKIIEQHGGRIWAESRMGTGSTFHVVLPRQLEQPEQKPTPRPAVTPRESSALPAMLVCSDNRDRLEAVAQQMTRAGYRVLLAASAEEAIRHAELERPGALLVDLPVAGQQGWSGIVALRDQLHLKDVPILVLGLSAMNDGGDAGSDELQACATDIGNGHAGDDFVNRELPPGQRAVHRILLVEDDPDLAGVLIAMFQQHCIETVHARSGREAVEAAMTCMPDLVVLDVGLPEGDGFHVVRGLKQDKRLRQAPLVVYSGRHLNAVERSELCLGPTEFLTKGQIAPEEFERHVLQLLAQLMA